MRLVFGNIFQQFFIHKTLLGGLQRGLDFAIGGAIAQFNPPEPPLFLTYLLISPRLRLHALSCSAFQSRTLQAILSRFYSCETTRPPSSLIASVAPRRLLGLISPNLNLAPKENEKFDYCRLDLV